MKQLPVVCLVLLFLGLAVAWDNDWDQPLHKVCNTGNSFVRIASIHDNGYEDRRYKFDCGRHAPSSHHCHWTGYVNDWDGEMNFQCPNNYVVSGVSSYHDDGKEDRRFTFKCCKLIEPRQKFCYWTSNINDWDDPMDYGAPRDVVIRGFHSWHDDGKEDRRWRVYICRV